MKKDYFWLHLRDLPYFRALLRSVESTFYQEIQFARPILDVGCGDGHFAQVTFDDLIDIGVDLDLKIMRKAQRRERYRTLVQSDGAILPFDDNSLASAISNSVLEHIPHLNAVLNEVGRVLRPGAHFVFTVPNPGYRSELSVPRALNRLGLSSLSKTYVEWFMVMSRTVTIEYEQTWADRLSAAGFEILRTFRYFSPAALRTLEWGHYFGAPCLIPHAISGNWIISPTHWNLWLTDRLIRKYHDAAPIENGTYSYYRVIKR